MKTTIYMDNTKFGVLKMSDVSPQSLKSAIFSVLRMPLFISSWYYLGTQGSEDTTFILITSGWAIALGIQLFYGLIMGIVFHRLSRITYAEWALKEVVQYCFVTCFLIKFTRGGSSDTDPRLLASIAFTVIPCIIIVCMPCCGLYAATKSTYKKIKLLQESTVSNPAPQTNNPSKAIMAQFEV